MKVRTANELLEAFALPPDIRLTAISQHATGVYMAFPTTPVLKPIYRKLKTHVNNQHTKVGITTDSFAKRAREYRNTFQGEVQFLPLVEVPANQLLELEALLLAELCARYQRVGRAREWFDTAERERIVQVVMSVIDRIAGRAG